MNARPLYLCAGTQSSGSTLISWCFLQRPEMDGMLDARFDIIPQMPPLARPVAWCKFTVACFRFSEVRDHFEAEGYDVKPLLVVRDVRSVFNSLIDKKYGRNGVTADDPPLRVRLTRFLDDWRMFRDRGWPLLRYEDLADDPVAPLARACEQLGLPWDEAMNTWPKSPAEIADAGYGNETFMVTKGGTLRQTLNPALLKIKTGRIPPRDLEWLEGTFAEMNRGMNYPENVPGEAPATPERATPRFEVTRRYERIQRRTRLSRSIRKVANVVMGVLPARRPMSSDSSV